MFLFVGAEEGIGLYENNHKQPDQSEASCAMLLVFGDKLVDSLSYIVV